MFRRIDIGLPVKTDCVDNKRVPFPFAYGVAQPVRHEVLRMVPTVDGNHVENIVRFETANGKIQDLEDVQLPMNFGGPTAQA